MIIQRPYEIKRVTEGKKWTLVYGRRKTGKTFLVENNVRFDLYFFVNREGTIISKIDNKPISYDTLLELIRMNLKSDKTIVVDEFHRLGDGFFDFLHAYSTGATCRLVLLTSTLFLATKLLSSGSPLLGLFKEVKIQVISLADALNSLRHANLNKKSRLELAIMLREPLDIDYYDGRRDPREVLSSILVSSTISVPALIGEIFSEEERSISTIYKAIIGAVASGRAVSSEISSHLFSNRLIKKDDPSTIQQYLENLLKLGILKKLGVYGKKKRFVYKIDSPLIQLFYYAEEKYGISDRKISEREALRIIDEIMPRIVEDNVREFLAEKLNLVESVAEGKDYNIDGVLLKFKSPEVVLEVKWRGSIAPKDIRKAEVILGEIEAKRKVLFVQDKKGMSSDALEITDVSDL